MKVILDHILITEKVAEEKKTETGFILPTDKIDWSKPQKSEVIAVGGDVKEVKVGDTVYYLPKVGDSITEDGIIYRIIREADVVAIE